MEPYSPHPDNETQDVQGEPDGDRRYHITPLAKLLVMFVVAFSRRIPNLHA
jgi:hypothetical protein